MCNKTVLIIMILLGSLVLLPLPANAQRREPLFATSGSAYSRVRVKKVASAGTFFLDNGEKVMLIGLKAPEPPEREKIEYDQFGFVAEKENPLKTVEDRAFDFAKHLLEGKDVRLEFDVERRGPHQVIYAYAFLADNGLFVNEEILRQGFASLSIQPPNLKYANRFRAAYQEARREKRGIHGE